MATNKAENKKSYPLPVYNYRVFIGGQTQAFQEVSGLSMEFETITYKHGLSWKEGAEQMPGMSGEVKLSLKRGIVKQRSLLLNWIRTIRLNKVEKRDIRIELCDESGAAVISWKVFNAFPTKMDVPSFDINSNDVAIESMDLIANRLEIEYH